MNNPTGTGFEQAENPEHQAYTARRKPPKRNRSVKRRPQDVPGVIAALREDTIDLRTREAQDVLALRDALAKNPEPVVQGLVRDALAIDGVIMARIAAELVKPGSSILNADGELHPLITKYWPDVRGGILKSGKALVDLERKSCPANDQPTAPVPLDISTIILRESVSDDNE